MPPIIASGAARNVEFRDAQMMIAFIHGRIREPPRDGSYQFYQCTFFPEAMNTCRVYTGYLHLSTSLIFNECRFINCSPGPLIDMYRSMSDDLKLMVNGTNGEGDWGGVGRILNIELDHLNEPTLFSILDTLSKPDTHTTQLRIGWCPIQEEQVQMRGQLSSIRQLCVKTTYQRGILPYVFSACQVLDVNGWLHGLTNHVSEAIGLLNSCPSATDIKLQAFEVMAPILHVLVGRKITKLTLHNCTFNAEAFGELTKVIIQSGQSIVLEFTNCSSGASTTLLDEFFKAIQYYPVIIQQLQLTPNIMNEEGVRNRLMARFEANQVFFKNLAAVPALRNLPAEMRRQLYMEKVGPWDMTYV